MALIEWKEATALRKVATQLCTQGVCPEYLDIPGPLKRKGYKFKFMQAAYNKAQFEEI